MGRPGRHPRVPGADGRRHDHGANLAIWTPEDGWVVENEGVPPDIEVEQTPADVIAGRDPQLEKAIEVVLAELKKNLSREDRAAGLPGQGKTQRGTVPDGGR